MIRQWLAKSTLLALLIGIAAALPQPPAAGAAESDTDTGLPVRTAQEVAAKWRALMNPKADISHPYITAPSVTNPYAPGSLRQDYILDGLNVLNFYRFVSGLPGDVETADDLNRKAAYGAVLLASEGNFGHTPPKPARMDDDFYNTGYASTSTANIFASYGYNNHILVSAIESYMDDSDTFNLDRLGHRRWILNPPLKLTGTGLAKGKDGFSYSVLQVFDKSRDDTLSYNYIPYPAKGVFPVEVFKPTTAWSVSLNPDEFAKPGGKDVQVTLKRVRDNRSWKLNAGAGKVTEKGAYFNVENSGYGSGPAIIFRPDGIDEYRPGDVYQVRIDGLTDKAGSARPISYTVQFMSAKNPGYAAPKFADTSRHWASQTIDWAADLGIASGYTNGTFQPDKTVTEAEFLKMFTTAIGTDIVQSGYWSDAYYVYAGEHGYTLRGFNESSARAAPIRRTAVAELFASAAGQDLKDNDAITYMLERGYSKGKTAPTLQGYQGADTLTRAEAVQFIKNALDANYTIPTSR